MKKDLSKEYAAFERLMDVDEIYRDESLSFSDACAMAGATPSELEQMIADELGYLGDEIMEVYRCKSLL